MLTINRKVSNSILIGGLMTAATLFAAYVYQRKRELGASADNLFDACEDALHRFGGESQNHSNNYVATS